MICLICNKELKYSSSLDHYICLSLDQENNKHYSSLYDDNSYFIHNEQLELVGTFGKNKTISCSIYIKMDNYMSKIISKYENTNFEQACKLFVKYSNLKVFM